MEQQQPYPSGQDHPRSRGKDKESVMEAALPPGSPPLTRERPYFLVSRLSHAGITPAHAGKTLMNISKSASSWDHPRSRGKDNALYLTVIRALGSPPLTRERQVMRVNDIDNEGITPAHAGKTPASEEPAFFMEDHPRSRGKDSH